MIDCEDYVTLSDDDCTTEVTSNLVRGTDVNTMETIVIDEEFSQRSTHSENNNDIKLDDYKIDFTKKCLQKKLRCIPGLNKMVELDTLFTQFITKCIDLENSDGMLRIINKTLIKVYEQSDVKYRESPEYLRVLQKALNRLEKDPEHKFSHVKDMVETLKLHVKKKRVQLTTLATNLKENSNTKPTFQDKNQKSNDIVIDLEDYHEEATIVLDDEPNDVIVLDDEEKENQHFENGSQDNNLLIPQSEVPWEPHRNNEISSSQETTPAELNQDIDMERVNQIEKEIASCKETIARLEEKEVDDDTMNSPYVLCEKYKSRIVKLYEQLCELVGAQSTKKRKVKLQVLEGHPPGPVRKLESFINENIGADGIPLFPDFCDVIKCVMVSNLEDNLGWNKQQVLGEACALFNQCGRGLQKQRQRREYRDLMSLIKMEPPDDPADEDPALQARLEENRRLAMKKENDLLERFTMLQYAPPLPQQYSLEMNTARHLQTCARDDDSEDSDFEPPEVSLSQNIEKDTQDGDTVDSNDNCSIETEVKVKQEPMDISQMLEDLGDNYTMSIIAIHDPFLVIEISSDSSDSEE